MFAVSYEGIYISVGALSFPHVFNFLEFTYKFI